MAGRAGCAWRASKRTRLGFSNWISDVSSMRRIRSSSAMNLASAFSRVVLPHPVPPLMSRSTNHSCLCGTIVEI